MTHGEDIQETSTVQMDDVTDDFNANVDDVKEACNRQVDENNNDSGVYVLKGDEINEQGEIDCGGNGAEMMDKEYNEGGSGWTDDDDWGYSDMDDGDKDDENSGDSDGEIVPLVKTVVKMVILVKMK